MLEAAKKAFGVLTLARKAGKLVLGFDAVKETLQNRTAKLAVITSDVSPKTEKEVRFYCTRACVDIISVPLSMDEVSKLLGKKSGVISVTDGGLAELIKKKYNEYRTSMEDNKWQ
ncbi:MAG: ribosomal L7Ae/L30e/S12e/Gadd45 family protein [Ruminococcus sp.]|jgi:ribosomal protein L7Ae-like RNA K-turn-binding protein|nr:ribosomal L7Ae/L30e/S12e/Gadd45 family protein [Ruminococcus sp.]